MNLGKSKREALDISSLTLANLGLVAFEDRMTFRLSGGEKPPVSLATVLAMEPDALLLDEPLTGLDSDTRSKLVEIISTLNQFYIIISHDVDFLMSMTDKSCTLQRGRIRFEADAQIHERRLVHLHGAHPHSHD